MSEEHDSWLKSALGVDVGKALRKIESAGSSAISRVTSPGAQQAAPAQQPAPAGEPETAAASSPGVLDRLKSTASNAGNAVRGAASKALNAGDAAGKAVLRAESAAWDGTKKAYGAATGAYDKVAPNFNESNKTLGKLVDAGEAAAKKGNTKAADKYGRVPVLGKVLKASAAVSNTAVDALGGVVKGAGDLTAMAGNAIVHPIDAAGSMAEGALGIAEHVPMAPGVNTTVKAAHGLVDLARGKKDGEYGGNLKDLGKNLALGTHQDPNDPGKRTNADLDFAAGLGGGTKAWSEKPAEAATRTLVNLAPMFVGDEAAQGNKPAPKGGPPVPEGPNAPRGVDPFGKTQVDALGKTQVDALGKTQVDAIGKTQVDALGKTQGDALGKTQVDALGKTQDLSQTQDLGKTQVDLGKTQPGFPDEPPPTEVDPPIPDTEPADFKLKRGQTPEQILKNMQDTMADYKAANQAHSEAIGEWVRYRATKPNPGRGVVGDPAWDPKIEEQLKKEMKRTEIKRDAAAKPRDAALKTFEETTGWKLKGNTWVPPAR